MFSTLIAWVLLIHPAGAQTPYFPTGDGLSSTFVGQPTEIARTVTLNPVADLYRWDGPFGPRVIGMTEAGQLFEVKDGGRRLLIDLEASVGETWTVSGLDDDLVSGSMFTVADRGATLSVPLGTYSDVIHLAVRPRDGLADAGTTDLWFAPAVGLIKWQEITIAGPQSYELARLVFLEPERRVGVRVRSDRRRYTATDGVHVSYELTNLSGEPIPVRFPSGQRYDLAIVDPVSERRLWTWGMNKLFIATVLDTMFASQDTFRFEETIDLRQVGPVSDRVLVLDAYLTVDGALPNGLTLEETKSSIRVVVGDSTDVPPIRRLGRTLRVQARGDSVVAVYAIWNLTRDRLRMMYRSGEEFDLVLSDSRGDVWRWSDGRGFTDALWERSLAPGDSVVVEAALPKLEGIGGLSLRGRHVVTVDEPGSVGTEETWARIRLSFQEDEGDPAKIRKADFDSSGMVDFDDFLFFASSFGTRSGDPGYRSLYDLDEDGSVGFPDFLSFARSFGQSP